MANDNTFFFIILCLFITYPFVVGTVLADFGTTTTYTDINPYLETDNGTGYFGDWTSIYTLYRDEVSNGFSDFASGEIGFIEMFSITITGAIGFSGDWISSFVNAIFGFFGSINTTITSFLTEVIEGVPFIGDLIVTVIGMLTVFFSIPDILPSFASAMIFSVWGFMLLYLIVKIVKDLVPTT